MTSVEMTSRNSVPGADRLHVRLDERQMYRVDWVDGNAFGFRVAPLRCDRGTVLMLSRRTASLDQLEQAGLHGVVPGDLLVAIGKEKVYKLGGDAAAKYLQYVKKPVQLTLQLSPFGPTGGSNPLPDLSPNEYTCVWESGPLGIVFAPDRIERLPRVKRLTGKSENPMMLQDVAVGDHLVYANHLLASDWKMKDLIPKLQRMTKPVLLRFRKPLEGDDAVALPPLEDDEYEFLWEYGPLGLVIGVAKSGLPFVRSFTGKGTSNQLDLVQPHDEIVMVNDKFASEEGFTKIMDFIMHVPKPAVIRFRRASAAAHEGIRESEDLHAFDAQHDLTFHHHRSTSDNTAPLYFNDMSHDQHGQQPKSSMDAPGRRFGDDYDETVEYTDLSASMGNIRLGGNSETLRENARRASEWSNNSGMNHPSIHEKSPMDFSNNREQSLLSMHSSSGFLDSPQQVPSGSSNSMEVEFFESDSTANYQIKWTDGPFGFTVREARTELGSAMLVTKRTGKSTCKGLRRAAVGDILVQIGDKSVAELGFEQATQYLRQVAKPVSLTFQAID